MTGDRTLERYRAALERVDARLLGTYAERRRLVAELMEYKRRAGLPPFDLIQERRVLERARRAASTLGLPASQAEALVRWVLERVHEEAGSWGARGPEGSNPTEALPSGDGSASVPGKAPRRPLLADSVP